MKLNLELDEQSLEALKNAFNDKPEEAPDTIRVYAMGEGGCSGPRFGLAFDGMLESDLLYETEGIKIIMDKDEYASYGDIRISFMGSGFLVAPVNQPEGGCSTCSGCH